MKQAPIILFTYNRPLPTKKTVEALQKNVGADQSDLFIFSDAAKKEEDISNVKQVREYLHTIGVFRSVTIIERESNYGLSNNIIDGVTQVVAKYKKAIVIEDDLLTSSHFLQFMNEGLEKYEHSYEVISIHGYCLPIEYPKDVFFLKGADCWGWATWERGWQLFDPDGMHLMKQLREQNSFYEFDLEGCYDYSGMLQKQVEGEINSWAIRWYASAFIHNKLTLYPGRSLVANIGTDRSGTHAQNERMHRTQLSDKRIVLEDIPITDSKLARKLISQKLFKHLGIKGKLKKVFKWGY